MLISIVREYISAGLDPGNIEHLPFVWHKGKDFLKNDEQPVPLIYRMATVEDRKGRAHAKSSRYLWLEGVSQPKVYILAPPPPPPRRRIGLCCCMRNFSRSQPALQICLYLAVGSEIGGGGGGLLLIT